MSTPTASNYFGRINRNGIIEAMGEAGLPMRTRTWSKRKKAELACLAERELQTTGWMPQPMRKVAVSVQDSEAHDDVPVATAA